jgi:hypothetical protein
MEPICTSDGTPEMRPAIGSKPMPLGSDDSRCSHTQAPAPPVHTTDWEYGCWRTPSANLPW